MTQREQHTTEQSARAAQRLGVLGEMTGGLVHDFRNILAIIGSSLTLAERHSRDPEKLRASIGKAQEGIRRGTELIAQLLTFSKEQDVGARVENLNVFLKQLELFLKSGAGPEISLALQLASDIPKCLIDQTQFNASILNLVVNARDALPKGGTIEISTERWAVKTVTPDAPLPGLYVRLQVKDNGQGMPPGSSAEGCLIHFSRPREKVEPAWACRKCRLSCGQINGHVSIASERGAEPPSVSSSLRRKLRRMIPRRAEAALMRPSLVRVRWRTG